VLYAKGSLDEAEVFFRETLERRGRVLGNDHPQTLASAAAMGLLLHAQGNLGQSQLYLANVLERRRLVLGDEHPDTLASINDLGLLFRAQGALTESESLLRDALEKRRRVLGDNHPDTLRSVGSMGGLLADRGMHPEAFELVEPAESEARKAFIEGNQRDLGLFLTALARARIGLGYDPDRFALAQNNLLEAHAIYFAAPDRGPSHKDTLECVQALVDLYTAWDAAEPGKGYDEKAAEWRAKMPIGEPQQTAATP